MYPPMEMDNGTYYPKPMNCPMHCLIFRDRQRSYRELPLRLFELGNVYRYERAGTLHGLLRIRGFTQDDSHIFCTQEHLADEIGSLLDFVLSVLRRFGFDDFSYKLSTRNADKSIGTDEMWDRAEQGLSEALKANDIAYDLQPGEGAFYGPKIEFTLHDCLGRAWQCGTVQLDFALPGRLGATFVAESGEKQTPVMIHRAILGSIERFIGILIEEYAGLFPAWLAPTQVVVMNITDNQAEYVQNLVKTFKSHGIRVISDLRNEKIGFKIREHTLKRIPYLVVVGDKEMEAGDIALRTRKGEDLGKMSVAAFVEKLTTEIKTRV